MWFSRTFYACTLKLHVNKSITWGVHENEGEQRSVQNCKNNMGENWGWVDSIFWSRISKKKMYVVESEKGDDEERSRWKNKAPAD